MDEYARMPASCKPILTAASTFGRGRNRGI
jgi:hypothetical protein